MGLSMQYFIIYTLLANDQTGNQFATNAHLGMQKILETACTIVTYSAMLSVLPVYATLMLAPYLDIMRMLYDSLNTVTGAVFTRQRPP